LKSSFVRNAPDIHDVLVVLSNQYFKPLGAGHYFLYVRNFEFLDNNGGTGESFLSLPLFDKMKRTCQSPVAADVMTLQVKPGAIVTSTALFYRSLESGLTRAESAGFLWSPVFCPSST
jgi:hypothetical protein